MSQGQAELFDVPESLWVRRRCLVCGCALSLEYAFTYLVRRQGWVKIGATSNIRRRVNELARPAWAQHILSPADMDWSQPLEHLLTLEGGHHEHALHQRFRDDHARGEWFTASQTLVDWITSQPLTLWP